VDLRVYRRPRAPPAQSTVREDVLRHDARCERFRERPSSLIVAGRVRTHAVVSALIDNCFATQDAPSPPDVERRRTGPGRIAAAAFEARQDTWPVHGGALHCLHSVGGSPRDPEGPKARCNTRAPPPSGWYRPRDPSSSGSARNLQDTLGFCALNRARGSRADYQRTLDCWTCLATMLRPLPLCAVHTDLQ
jgi:hypothetical protein